MTSIIHIDSTYRNINLYPYPAEFILPINGTPPTTPLENDSRSIYYCYNYVFARFKWIGYKNTPTGRKPSSTLAVSFITQSSNSFILNNLPSGPMNHIDNDYFVGLLFIVNATGESSVIVSYDAQTFTLTTQYEFSSSSLQETTGTIENISYIEGNRDSIIVLGSSTLLPQMGSAYLLCRGISTSFFIENVSKGWSLRIKSFNGFYRNAQLTSDMPCYDEDDVFQVRFEGNQNVSQIQSYSFNGIITYTIPNGGIGYQDGQKVYVFAKIRPAVFIVETTDVEGKILTMRMYDAGEGFEKNTTYVVYSFTNPYNYEIPNQNDILNETASIFVNDVGTIVIPSPTYTYQCGIKTIRFDLNNFVNARNLLIFFPLHGVGRVGIPINPVIQYYNVIAVNKNGIIVDTPYIQDIGNLFEIISYKTVFPNIILPMVSYHQSTCFEITIASISLPNLPVDGYNVLLANFPYVLVTLTNSTSTVGNSINTLISNNPNVLRDAFVCPIANIRNPDIVKFVVVYSRMKVQMKFKMGDNLLFRVALQDGTTLGYNNDPTIIPMNIFANDNSKKVYAYSTDRLISATFLLKTL